MSFFKPCPNEGPCPTGDREGAVPAVKSSTQIASSLPARVSQVEGKWRGLRQPTATISLLQRGDRVKHGVKYHIKSRVLGRAPDCRERRRGKARKYLMSGNPENVLVITSWR